MVVSQCGGPTAPSGDLLLKRVTSEGEAERDAMLRISFGEDVVLLRVCADLILMKRCRLTTISQLAPATLQEPSDVSIELPEGVVLVPIYSLSVICTFVGVSLGAFVGTFFMGSFVDARTHQI